MRMCGRMMRMLQKKLSRPPTRQPRRSSTKRIRANRPAPRRKSDHVVACHAVFVTSLE